MSKIVYKCKVCNSTDVVKDAWAEWDEKKQRWTLENIFDMEYCKNCDGETKLIEEEIPEECPSCGSFHLDQIDDLTCCNDYHSDDPLWAELQIYLNSKK